MNNSQDKHHDDRWHKYAKVYDPIKCASIDGTDNEPHDRAVIRALNSEYRPNRFVKGHPECTIFISRLNHETSKETIKEVFSSFGKIKRFRLVRDIVTGMPKGYGFIEYEEEQSAEEAYRYADKKIIDGKPVFVDFECERLLTGWKPRRLGGGFGGKKESGQLRFGGRDRPFRMPIALEQEEKRKREETDRRHRRRDKSRDRKRTKSKSKERSSNGFRTSTPIDKEAAEKRPPSPKVAQNVNKEKKPVKERKPSAEAPKRKTSNERDPNKPVKAERRKSGDKRTNESKTKTEKPATKKEAPKRRSPEHKPRHHSPIRKRPAKSPIRKPALRSPEARTRHRSPPRRASPPPPRRSSPTKRRDDSRRLPPARPLSPIRRRPSPERVRQRSRSPIKRPNWPEDRRYGDIRPPSPIYQASPERRRRRSFSPHQPEYKHRHHRRTPSPARLIPPEQYYYGSAVPEYGFNPVYSERPPPEHNLHYPPPAGYYDNQQSYDYAQREEVASRRQYDNGYGLPSRGRPLEYSRDVPEGGRGRI